MNDVVNLEGTNHSDVKLQYIATKIILAYWRLQLSDLYLV